MSDTMPSESTPNVKKTVKYPYPPECKSKSASVKRDDASRLSCKPPHTSSLRQCQYCPTKFDSYTILQQHHQGHKALQEKLAKQSSASEQDFESSYQCKYRWWHFPTTYSRSDHERALHLPLVRPACKNNNGNTPYNCPHSPCQRFFSAERHLKQHIALAHTPINLENPLDTPPMPLCYDASNPQGRYICLVCSYLVKMPYTLKFHVRKKHGAQGVLDAVRGAGGIMVSKVAQGNIAGMADARRDSLVATKNAGSESGQA